MMRSATLRRYRHRVIARSLLNPLPPNPPLKKNFIAVDQWLGQFSKALGGPAFYRGEHPR
jgi:hypothetical protein